jgi:outer membrane protein TolC
VRRTVEQARANAQADAAEAANVDLTLHAELATDYFALRGLDSEIKLLTSTVADLEHQLDLTQRRLTGGVATGVDVAQARTQLETVRAQLVDLGVARAQYEHAIGTIANYDLSGFSIPPSPLDLALPKVPLGVPSQLLERRPDIAEQERLAAAANAQIGIQISAFYPDHHPRRNRRLSKHQSRHVDSGAEHDVDLGAQARNCFSTPGSATLSPMPRGTATKRRRTAIATRSFRPSTT